MDDEIKDPNELEDDGLNKADEMEQEENEEEGVETHSDYNPPTASTPRRCITLVACTKLGFWITPRTLSWNVPYPISPTD